jgi:hypothetical protein
MSNAGLGGITTNRPGNRQIRGQPAGSELFVQRSAIATPWSLALTPASSNPERPIVDPSERRIAMPVDARFSRQASVS